jgi:hypothetical protein
MARVYPILRGVDNELEFRGLRGKYFYYAVAGVIGGIFLALLLYIVGINLLVAFALMVLTAGGSLIYVFSANKTYGRWGTVKQPVRRLKPHYVYQNRSFRQLISVHSFPKRKL